MTSTRFAFAVALTSAVACFGVAATASASPLVQVNLIHVLDDIALDLDVDVSQIPLTVQAPITLAATVCGVGVNVLAKAIEDTGVAKCDAKATSSTLNKLVQRQL